MICAANASSTTPGIAVDQVSVLYNFVDLRRFQPREPLPASPRSALVFSNYASSGTFTDSITAACRNAGIERVDIVGAGSGNAVENPEEILGNYDIVFAKARCALEAMATGCAVVVADFAGLGGLVTSTNVETLRKLNFGFRTMQQGVLSTESVAQELNLYDAADAQAVSTRIQAEADLSTTVDRWIDLYTAALSRWQSADRAGVAVDVSRAASAYLRTISGPVKTAPQADHEAHLAKIDKEAIAAELATQSAYWAAIQQSQGWRLLNRYWRMRNSLRRRFERRR